MEYFRSYPATEVGVPRSLTKLNGCRSRTIMDKMPTCFSLTQASSNLQVSNELLRTATPMSRAHSEIFDWDLY